MTEQERLAAALEYQQAQQPARMNPNLAAQGARGRENMMPPTSIMDERYPAFKRNQEDAEKLMLGLDIVGSAIPLAGPAAKGAVALGKYAAPQIAQGLENYAFRTGMALPMDVWHGSGVRFSPTAKNPLGEFDPTKIGTGEGAQVYGYGHYLAEAKDVGKSYKEALQTTKTLLNGKTLLPADPNFSAASSIAANGYDKALAMAKRGSTEQFLTAEGREQSALLAKQIETLKDAKIKNAPSGSLYKVDLPDEAIPRMLDWDKPLSQQSESVKKALSVDKRAKDSLYQDVGEYYRALTSRYAANAPAHMSVEQAENWAQQFASQKLREMGIPGIQYLDAGSRGAGTGTRNFVVFPGNEGLLNILGRE